jgi:hypothetical protein
MDDSGKSGNDMASWQTFIKHAGSLTECNPVLKYSADGNACMHQLIKAQIVIPIEINNRLNSTL